MTRPLKPASTRKWLYYAAGALFLVISVTLLFRAMTGSTMQEQKSQRLAERFAEDLARKPAPNAESLSVKLENARADAAKATEPPAGGAVSPQSPPADSWPGPVPESRPPAPAGGRPGTDSAASRPPLPMEPGRIRIPPLGAPSGGDGSEINEGELADYEQKKRAQMIDTNRKMATWEPSGTATDPSSAADVGGPSRTGGGSGTTASTSSQSGNLIDAYLRATQAGQTAQDQPSSHDRFRQGLAKQTSIAEPLRPQPVAGRYLIAEGTHIPVVLDVKVSSDIGGPCRGHVVHDIYDSLSQTALLVPAGSRVICTYDSGVVQGQERLLIAFTRLTLPSGQALSLGGMQGADTQGAIGAPAEVNSRFWRIFGSSLLIAAVTRAAERSSPASASPVTINTQGSGAASTAAGVLAETARKVLDRNLNIKPELVLRPGEAVRVVASRDIVLDPIAFR
jgi:type IV secretion system protein TrbI